MLRISLFISGDLGFSCLLDIYKKPEEIKCVFTNKSSLKIIEFAANYKIPVFIGNPNVKNGLEFLEKFDIDLLLSINYIFLLEKNIFNFPQKYAINFHGSLLPKYRGRTPHVWAIINNEKSTGITAHLIDAGCDTGAIVLQKKIKIEKNDTGNDLLSKFKLTYPEMVTDVLTLIKKGELECELQDEAKATYFNKRGPEDGLINWNWSKERIRNWVRAQAKPYPGAFTLFEKHKLFIYKIRYSDYGFSQSDPNGMVLNCNPLLVKTHNGAVEIIDYKNTSDQKIELLYVFN